MREEEGRTALYSMADAHAAVRPRAVRSDSGRPRSPDRLIGQSAIVAAQSDGPWACPADPTDMRAARPI